MANPTLTTVVNLHHTSDYDVYVGRGPCPRSGKYHNWGNGYRIGDLYEGIVIDRDLACDLYEQWLMKTEGGHILRRRIGELVGKRLGCWCKQPGKDVRCHGDLLAKLANEWDGGK